MIIESRWVLQKRGVNEYQVTVDAILAKSIYITFKVI